MPENAHVQTREGSRITFEYKENMMQPRSNFNTILPFILLIFLKYHDLSVEGKNISISGLIGGL